MGTKQIIILIIVIVGLAFVGSRAIKQYQKFNPPPAPGGEMYDEEYDEEGDSSGTSTPSGPAGPGVAAPTPERKFGK